MLKTRVIGTNPIVLALSAGDIYTLCYSVIQNEGKNELNISLYTLTQKERVYLALVFILPIACFIIVKVKIFYEAGIEPLGLIGIMKPVLRG